MTHSKLHLSQELVSPHSTMALNRILNSAHRHIHYKASSKIYVYNTYTTVHFTVQCKQKKQQIQILYSGLLAFFVYCHFAIETEGKSARLSLIPSAPTPLVYYSVFWIRDESHCLYTQSPKE